MGFSSFSTSKSASSSILITKKVEGTSTTYGQNIQTLSPGSSPVAAPLSTASAAQDTIVQVETITPAQTVASQAESSQLLQGEASVNIAMTDVSQSNIAMIAASSESGNTSISVSAPGMSQADSQVQIEGSPLLQSVVVPGSAYKTKEEIRKILTEAQKVNLSISLKSPRSDSVDINLLKIPTLQAKMVYNFFEVDEEDIVTQEDQSKDPLLRRKPIDVPRYVEISWNIAETTEPLSETEIGYNKNKLLRQDAFSTKGGVSGYSSTAFKSSVSKSEKDNIPFSKDGVQFSLVDGNNLEKGFDSTVNKQSFANTMSAVINVDHQSEVLTRVPVTPPTDKMTASSSKTMTTFNLKKF